MQAIVQPVGAGRFDPYTEDRLFRIGGRGGCTDPGNLLDGAGYGEFAVIQVVQLDGNLLTDGEERQVGFRNGSVRIVQKSVRGSCPARSDHQQTSRNRGLFLFSKRRKRGKCRIYNT